LAVLNLVPVPEEKFCVGFKIGCRSPGSHSIGSTIEHGASLYVMAKRNATSLARNQCRTLVDIL
jgi:hypothetical protein